MGDSKTARSVGKSPSASECPPFGHRSRPKLTASLPLDILRLLIPARVSLCGPQEVQPLPPFNATALTSRTPMEPPGSFALRGVVEDLASARGAPAWPQRSRRRYGRLVAPEAAGFAASLGLSDYADDLEQLESGMLLSDTFYAGAGMPRTNPHCPPTS